MATSKGRGGTAPKAASSKKSAAPSKGGGSKPGNTPLPTRSSGKNAAPAARNAAPVKAAAKNAASGSAGASKATAQRGGTATKAAGIPSSRNGKSTMPATASRSTPVKNTAGRGAVAPAPARKTAAPAPSSRGAAPRAIPARSGSSRAKGTSASADPRNDLEKILQDLMKDIYYAEKKLSKALGKMAKNATNPKLKDAFTTHQTQTNDQIAKLEEAFALLGYAAKAKKCAAMDGLLEEANEHIEEYAKGAGLDAAMIVGAQKVEHYEMAAYGSMRSFAKTLGYDEAAAIFEEIREQESDTDELLTTLAESVINLKAEEETNDVDEVAKSASGGNSDEDSKSGEDSSSADSGREGGDDTMADAGKEGDAGDLTDGNDREGASETGAAMGY